MSRFLFTLFLLLSIGLLVFSQALGQTPSSDVPRIVRVEPDAAPANAVVDILVDGDPSAITLVTFNNEPAKIVRREKDRIGVVVPSIPATGSSSEGYRFADASIRFYVPGKAGERSEDFRIISPNVSRGRYGGIAEIVPGTASSGSTVDIIFSEFVPVGYWGGIKVRFDNQPAQIVKMRRDSITVEVPPNLLAGSSPIVELTVFDNKSKASFQVSAPPTGEVSPPSNSVNQQLYFTTFAAVLLLTGAFAAWVLFRRNQWRQERERDELKANMQKVLERQERERDELKANMQEELEQLKFYLEQERRAKDQDALSGRAEKRNIVIEQPIIPEVPEELIDACVSRECIMFAGGGLGAQAGFPTWPLGLARIIDLVSDSDDPQQWDPLRKSLSAGDFSIVAELIRSRLPEGLLLKIVRDIYLEQPKELPVAHKALSEIRFAGILTLNWDRLLERSFSEHQPSLLSLNDSERLTPLLRDDRFFIMKIYGEPDRPETFLFTPEEYRQAIYENESFSKFVTSLFLSRVFFFVGVSLAGIEDFLSGLRLRANPNRTHYALVPTQPDIEIQAERFLTRYGVKLLVYEPTPGHPEFVSFIETIRDRVRGVSPVWSKTKVESANLDRVILRNIGPFTELDLELNRSWSVLLGNNGCGKSTVLKAIALGLCGDDPKAKEAASNLLRTGNDVEKGSVELFVGGNKYRTELFRVGRDVQIRCEQLTPLQAGKWVVLGFPPLRGVSFQNPRGPSRDGLPNPDVKDLLPLISGIVDNRLDSLKQWIINTHLRSQHDSQTNLREADRNKKLRDSFFEILGDLTPGLCCRFDHIDKESWQVMVRVQEQVVPIDLLSQGTNSIFGWVGTLLQRMYEIYGDSARPESEPALVLVDEVDAHMHPEWQRLLVPLMKKHFPNLQIIATTHSPLIVGNMKPHEVHHLRRDPESDEPIVERIDISFEGWRADQILTSPAFDLHTTISPKAVEVMNEYTKWLGKENRTPDEQAHFKRVEQQLRATIPQPPETEEARMALDLLEQWMLERLKNLSEERKKKIIEEAKEFYSQLKSGEPTA